MEDQTAKEIQNCIEVLKNGGTILYPSDTIWGIGCDATQSNAVKKINALKERPENQTYLVLLDDKKDLNKYVNTNKKTSWLLDSYRNKPVTIIYPYKRGLSADLIAEDQTIGIRVVGPCFCQELLKAYGKPIVSTSANKSGKPFPRQFSEIDDSILREVDYVVNLRHHEQSSTTPSAILKVNVHGEIEVIRE